MIFMLSMEHCSKCKSAIQALEQQNLIPSKNFEKIILPDNKEFMEVARELNISSMPAYIEKVGDKYIQLSFEEVVKTLK